MIGSGGETPFQAMHRFMCPEVRRPRKVITPTEASASDPMPVDVSHVRKMATRGYREWLERRGLRDFSGRKSR